MVFVVYRCIQDWQLKIPELLISKWLCNHGISTSLGGLYLYRSTNHFPRTSFGSSKSRESHDGPVTFVVPQKVPATNMADFQRPVFQLGASIEIQLDLEKKIDESVLSRRFFYQLAAPKVEYSKVTLTYFNRHSSNS